MTASLTAPPLTEITKALEEMQAQMRDLITKITQPSPPSPPETLPVGTQITFGEQGPYMLAAVGTGKGLLIGLESGNRWSDLPLILESQQARADSIEALVGHFTVVHEPE